MDKPLNILEVQWIALPKHKDWQDRELAQYVLDEEENGVYERYHTKRKRLEFVTGRALVKEYIGEKYGVASDKIKLIKNAYGKPVLDKSSIRTEGQEIYFNITHTDEIVAAVFGHREQVGIDVEQVREDHRSIMTSVLTSRELDYVNSLPYNVIEILCMIWTRKEARLKAEGYGLSRLLNSIEVPLSLEKIEAEGYHWESHRLPNNHWLSIVVEGGHRYSMLIKEVKWEELVQRIDGNIRKQTTQQFP